MVMDDTNDSDDDDFSDDDDSMDYDDDDDDDDDDDEHPIDDDAYGRLNERGIWSPIALNIGILHNPPPLDLLLQPVTIRLAVKHKPDYTDAESYRGGMDILIGQAHQAFTSGVSMQALAAAMTGVEAQAYPQAAMSTSSAQAYAAAMNEVPAQYFPTTMSVPTGAYAYSANVAPEQYYAATTGQIPLQANPEIPGAMSGVAAQSYLTAMGEAPAPFYPATMGQMPTQSYQLSESIEPKNLFTDKLGAMNEIAAYFESRTSGPTGTYPAMSRLPTQPYLASTSAGRRFSTPASTASMSGSSWRASSSESIDTPSTVDTPFFEMGSVEPSQSLSASPPSFKSGVMPTFSQLHDISQRSQRRFSEPGYATQFWSSTMNTAQNAPAMDNPSMIGGYENMGTSRTSAVPFYNSDFGIANTAENSFEQPLSPMSEFTTLRTRTPKRNTKRPRPRAMDTVQDATLATTNSPLGAVTYGDIRPASAVTDPSLISSPAIVSTAENSRKRSISSETEGFMATETRPAKRNATSVARLNVADKARGISSAPRLLLPAPNLGNALTSSEETIGFLATRNPRVDSDKGIIHSPSVNHELYHIASAPRDTSTASVIFPFSFWRHNPPGFDQISASDTQALKTYLATFHVPITSRYPIFFPHVLLACRIRIPSAQLPFQVAGLVAVWLTIGEPRPPGILLGDAVLNGKWKSIPRHIADDLFPWRSPRMQTLRYFRSTFQYDIHYPYIGLSYISRFIVIEVPYQRQKEWADIRKDWIGTVRAERCEGFPIRYHNGELTRTLPMIAAIAPTTAAVADPQEATTIRTNKDLAENSSLRGEITRPTLLSLDDLQYRDQFVVRIEHAAVPLFGLHRLQFEGKRYYNSDAGWKWHGIFSVSNGLRRLRNRDKLALVGTPVIRLREVQGGGYEETGEIGGYLGREVLSLVTSTSANLSVHDRMEASVLWFVEPAVEVIEDGDGGSYGGFFDMDG